MASAVRRQNIDGDGGASITKSRFGNCSSPDDSSLYRKKSCIKDLATNYYINPGTNRPGTKLPYTSKVGGGVSHKLSGEQPAHGSKPRWYYGIQVLLLRCSNSQGNLANKSHKYASSATNR